MSREELIEAMAKTLDPESWEPALGPVTACLRLSGRSVAMRRVRAALAAAEALGWRMVPPGPAWDRECVRCGHKWLNADSEDCPACAAGELRPGQMWQPLDEHNVPRIVTQVGADWVTWTWGPHRGSSSPAGFRRWARRTGARPV